MRAGGDAQGVFRITDPLPRGRVALEASAGTGKTWSIVGLAARALAEGRCTADGLLVVTFARSATRELRGRLLERLDDAVVALDVALADGPAALAAGDDDLLRSLVTADPDPDRDPTGDGGRTRGPVLDRAALRERRDRLAHALADIDSATVTTIHGFCAEALDRVGDVGRGALLDDEGAFAAEVAGDLRLRIARRDPDAIRVLPFPSDAIELARAAATVEPGDVVPDPDLGDWEGARAWVLVEARAEAERRKRRSRLHTYDDLLRRLADRLADPDHGRDAAERVGGRYQIALVDEFQDTDPVQWAVLERLFPDDSGADGRALVLVGDPKQAIYGFRGADVHAYVGARQRARSLRLDVNHRSDRAVVDAVLTLFEGQSMGQGIDVPPVTAAHADRIAGLGAPVAVSTIADDAPLRRTADGELQLGGLRDAVARDVARRAVEVLGAGARITDDRGTRDLAPADVAVLVRTRQQAAMVQAHLVDAGVPSVLNGVGNVLASPAARAWMHVLRALDRPSSGELARLAALTDLIGWPTGRAARADEADLDDLHVRLHDWRQVLDADGVAAAARRIGAETGMAARLLAQPDGDRRLTDLEHVAELLHAHHSDHVVGTAGLLAWLESAAAEAAAGGRLVPPDHLASRLERSGDAVQIMTVHGAKGLEFGVVLAPYLWDVVGRAPVVKTFHDHVQGRRRALVARKPRGPEQQDMEARAAQERDQEERRLAYVAATRARHHLHLWWAPGGRAQDSPLGALLGRPAPVRTTAEARASIAALQAARPGAFDLHDADVGARLPTWSPPPLEGPDPVLAPFERPIDHGWRRSSYSRLVGAAHAAADEVGSQDAVDRTGSAPSDRRTDPEDLPDDDPGEVPVVLPDPALDEEVPLGRMRGGADVGSALHAVLEHTDFTAEDLRAQLRREIDRQADRHAVDLTSAAPEDVGAALDAGDAGAGAPADPGADPVAAAAAAADRRAAVLRDAAHDVVAAGLEAALRTPLEPGGPALADLDRADRLDELAFELPVLAEDLAGQAGRVLLGDIADLLDAHLPADDPLAGYGAALRRAMHGIEVRGYLAGFVDLVARLPDGRYLIADHKTNRLAPAGADVVTAGHFTPAAMAAEMAAHHYPLQALLYLVAVHRFLRWRVPGYDPDAHLAGAAYLFLRGMTGPGTAVRDGMVCGVFRWRPPTPLLLALDRLLATGVDPADRAGDEVGR